MIKYIHIIEGRLRLRAGILKANAGLARELQIEIARIPGVHSVEINLQTGSILILHDGRKVTMDAIVAGLGPLAQASLRASLNNASQRNFFKRVAQAAVPHLVEGMLERLVMTPAAALL
jgi:copper chaperone CopZ